MNTRDPQQAAKQPSVQITGMAARCDGCGKDYPVAALADAERFVGAACEACGYTPVMTQDDFDNARAIVATVDLVAAAIPAPTGDTTTATMTVHSTNGVLDADGPQQAAQTQQQTTDKPLSLPQQSPGRKLPKDRIHQIARAAGVTTAHGSALVAMSERDNGEGEAVRAVVNLVDELLADRARHAAEVERLRAEIAAIWSRCRVTYYYSDGRYPIEHSPHAQKDGREAIEAALAAAKPATQDKEGAANA